MVLFIFTFLKHIFFPYSLIIIFPMIFLQAWFFIWFNLNWQTFKSQGRVGARNISNQYWYESGVSRDSKYVSTSGHLNARLLVTRSYGDGGGGGKTPLDNSYTQRWELLIFVVLMWAETMVWLSRYTEKLQPSCSVEPDTLKE